MSGEDPKMRGAIDRVAQRIVKQSQHDGKPVSHDTAREQAKGRAIDFERRKDK